MASELDAGIAELVWYGTETLRLRAHVASGTRMCPTRLPPYVAGARTMQVCRDDGCVDLMHDVYLRTVERLAHIAAAQEIASRLAYARRVISSQVADMERSRRVSRGLPAKPTRNDGIASRICAAMAEEHPDEHEITWLNTLFRMIRAYACHDHRRSAEWPLDIWAAEKTKVDAELRSVGSMSAQAELRRDIAVVLSTCERVAGRQWVIDSILHPLLMVKVSLSDEVERTVPSVESSIDDRVIAHHVNSRFRALRAIGLDDATSWRQAVREAAGQEPVGDVREVLDDLANAL
jgi:hypothetical protein